MTRVLHVIGELTRGGPTRALLTLTKVAAEVDHRVVSLRAGDRDELTAAIEATDIVHVHFWNNPQLYALLGSELPPMRLLVWPHVNGEHPPHVITPELLDFADRVVASCAYTTGLPGLEQLDVIPALAGWDRVQGVERNADPGFTVGYVGTLDFAKLHPGFVRMCAAVALPEARFLVCGRGAALGALRRQVLEEGLEERIEFRGFVEDIGAELARMDVFGYPLAEETYAASELVVQEAMYAGVPPVVMAGGSLEGSVIHGETGLVARSESEYARAIEHLHDHPEERRRLGAAAREHAALHWSPESIAPRWAATYESMMESPKRSRPPLPIGEGGAARFVRSVGGAAPEFRASLESTGDVAESERRIAGSTPLMSGAGGGIFIYRDFYPDDPHLRLWSGLVLKEQGRHALAAGEFAAAARMGLNRPLVSVIVPVKDGARFLAQALDSIFAQTHPPYEVVVVDGGSTDGSQDIARRYDKVTLVEQTGPGGFEGGWNDGLAVASAEVIAFIDSDDLWEPDKLAKQVAVLRERPEVDYVISRVRFFIEPGVAVPGDFDRTLLEGDHVANMPSALVIRREAFDAVGPFGTDYTIASDIDWFARAKDLPLKLATVPEVLVHKRAHDSNVSLTKGERFNRELIDLLRSSVGRRAT